MTPSEQFISEIDAFLERSGMKASTATVARQASIQDGISRQAAHDPKPSSRSFYARSTERASALHLAVIGHRSSYGAGA
jgi:hypothetical protein